MHFSRSLFLPHAWLRQHTRNPSGLFQTPLPSDRKGKYFCCHFYFYIFNRLENDFVELYSKLIRKAFILKPKIIKHLMHYNLKPILIFGFEKILPVLTNLKKPDSFQGWRFQKSFLAMTPWKTCFHNSRFDKKCKNHNDITRHHRSDNYDLKLWSSIKSNEVSPLTNKMVMKLSIRIKLTPGTAVATGLMRCVSRYMNVLGR